MLINPNSITVNILVTIMVVMMIFVLPAIDRRVCGKLGIDLSGGVSENAQADRLLKLRQLVLYLMFGIYILAVLYLTLLSRNAGSNFQVHVDLFQDAANSVQSDIGLMDILRIMFTEGIGSALSHIRVIRISGLTQVYMNIALLVPMGYLLPYMFRWFRQRVMIRPVMAAFITSFLIENIQLMTKRGLYDADDLVTNTFGGWIGQMMYIAVAYVLTHPDWKKDLKQYRRWKHNARKAVLYPFMRKISVSRTTLYASDETAVWDFYVKTLGFRVRKQLIPEGSDETSFLLEAAHTQIEIRCLNRREEFPPQYLTFSCSDLASIRKRLQKHGLDDGIYETDEYTGGRKLKFTGPDNVTFIILDEYEG